MPSDLGPWNFLETKPVLPLAFSIVLALGPEVMS